MIPRRSAYTSTMGRSVAEIQNSLHSRVKALIADSERVFLDFAAAYPVFVQEMKLSLVRSRDDIQKLGLGASFDDVMRGVFNSSRSVIADASERFNTMHDRDHAFLNTLNGGIATLSELDGIGRKVKEDSEEMELISLNAMTVALKSGAAGKAFSVITDDLQRLSARTIELTELLAGDSGALMELFQRYRSNVERLESAQNELFSGLDLSLKAKFGDIEQGVAVLGQTLSELADLSRGVEKPVLAIMEQVQVQDVIRQSLDHVVLALDELTSLNVSSPDGDRLFRQRLVELAAAILDDVKATLRGASDAMGDQMAVVGRIVEEGERRRRRLLDEMFGADESGNASKSFIAATETILLVENQTNAYMRQKNAIAVDGERLSGAVERLENRFQSFAKILNRFKTIDIASRIEVAKQAALRSMDDTVAEMSALTDRIGSDVAKALSATKRFLTDTRRATKDYTRVADEETALIHGTGEHLRTAYGQLKMLHLSLADQTRALKLFTRDFMAVVAASDERTAALRRLSIAVDDAIAEFAVFRRAAAEAVAASGRDELESARQSGRMKEIIDQLTIYAHKKTAADLSGLQVESGAELGEVMLF